jgi:hypothetical protein
MKLQSNTEILYVFEINRHGARAPLKDFGGQGFEVGQQQLTSAGMRQRYLLGKLNRMRYVEQYQFLSKTFNPSEIEVVSTDYYRTMQSAYS